MDSNEKFHINRLKLLNIDKIPKNCPKFVIEFLAKSLGIKYTFVNTSEWWDINEKIIVSFIENEHNCYMEKFDLRDIALFVNPIDNIEWTQRSILMKSFEHIHSFKGQLPIKDLKIGNKSEKEPFNIDPIMMYQICLKYCIITTRDSTFDELKNEIILINRRLTPIRNDIISSVYRLSREGLINLSRKIKNQNMDISNILPTDENKNYTNEEIVSMIKDNYQLDISLSSYPCQENDILEKIPIEDYIPFDKNFKDLYLKNPYYFRYDKRYYDNHIYTNEGLKTRLLFLNGSNHDSETLVLGIHPYCKETKTSIYQEELISDQEERRNIYLSTKNFVVSRDELYELWENLFTFNVPDVPSIEFSSKHINMIIRTGKGKLNELIYKIQGYRREKIDRGYSTLLNDLYIARKYLENIIDIGFVIRGYKVCYNSIPLKESSYDPKYQDEIEIKTSLEILNHLENKDFVKISEKIPVLTGKNILGQLDDTCEIKTYDKNSSIYDILKKIMNNTNDVDSCMRTNSNYLLLTGWYYMNRIFNIEPYNLSELNFVL